MAASGWGNRQQQQLLTALPTHRPELAFLPAPESDRLIVPPREEAAVGGRAGSAHMVLSPLTLSLPQPYRAPGMLVVQKVDVDPPATCASPPPPLPSLRTRA